MKKSKLLRRIMNIGVFISLVLALFELYKFVIVVLLAVLLLNFLMEEIKENEN